MAATSCSVPESLGDDVVVTDGMEHEVWSIKVQVVDVKALEKGWSSISCLNSPLKKKKIKPVLMEWQTYATATLFLFLL